MEPLKPLWLENIRPSPVEGFFDVSNAVFERRDSFILLLSLLYTTSAVLSQLSIHLWDFVESVRPSWQEDICDQDPSSPQSCSPGLLDDEMGLDNFLQHS